MSAGSTTSPADSGAEAKFSSRAIGTCPKAGTGCAAGTASTQRKDPKREPGGDRRRAGCRASRQSVLPHVSGAERATCVRDPSSAATIFCMKARPATAADTPRIAEIHVSAWRVAYRGQVPDAFLDGLSAERRTSAWSDIVAATAWPSTGVFVAEDDSGKLVGFAHVCASRDDDAASEVGEVTSIYIAPEEWHQGAGRALLDAATTTLRTAGFSRATLWVLDTNDRARQFYERLGWRSDGAVKVDDRGDFALREIRYATDLS